jgi:hypothetical protein
MTALEYASGDEAMERSTTLHGRSAVNISSFANGALGEQRRHEMDAIRLTTLLLKVASSSTGAPEICVRLPSVLK